METELVVVPVDGRQEAEELGEGRSPVGPVEVVAGAVRRAVDEGAARTSLPEDDSCGRVDMSRKCS